MKEEKLSSFPEVNYPKDLIKNLKSEVNEIKKSIEKGDQPIFDSIDSLFKELDK